MSKSNTIRHLYQPVQPTVKPSEMNVIYAELPPDIQLQHLIYCYWELKTTAPLPAQYLYRVVTDACIDIIIEADMPKSATVMGFCKTYTEFQLDKQFHYFGVRFLPAAFPQLFDVDAAELSHRTTDLESISKATMAWISDQIHEDLSLYQIKRLFDSHFIAQYDGIAVKSDARLHNAIAVILQNRGMLNIEKDLNTGISPRQLRRLFEIYVGDTPKVFSKVIRFQSLLQSRFSWKSPADSKQFYDFGYYDQAHFIKEFQTLYGATPGRAY